MLQLFDTHQHLVYRAQATYGWTEGIPALAEGDYTVNDYAKLVAGLGVGGTLFMEVAANEPDYQKELRFISNLASDRGNNIRGLIAAILPETADGFDAWLEECNNLGVVGYRRVLHVVDNSMSQGDTFRRNVRRIGACGKVFDMCFRADQLPLALELSKACPDMPLVLDHCGVPDIAGKALDPWRKHMAALAQQPHVVCKLSGLMAYCAPGESSLESIEPYVNHALETFGPSRMVWGSDWPVVDLGKGLPEWIAVTRTILGQLSGDEAQQVASLTATRTYQASLT